MDQDSFRLLLQTQGPRPVASLSSGSTSKTTTLSSSQPAFKPRKVKKSDADKKAYRDRAAERRAGESNDYAQVEAVLKDFEERTVGQDKSTLETQRRYLGGDSTHTVLVKGLDMALLDQNIARAATATTEDDEVLEKAFIEGTSDKLLEKPQASPTLGDGTVKKRTREDLIRELKAKRSQGSVHAATLSEQGYGKDTKVKRSKEEDARLLEEAKKTGKFRPIGFKAIGKEVEGKNAKAMKTPTVKKSKKRKNGGEKSQKAEKDELPHQVPVFSPPPPIKQSDSTTEQTPEQTPSLSDLDIFAGVGEYNGLDFSDSESSEDEAGVAGKGEGDPKRRKSSSLEQKAGDGVASVAAPRRWIDTGSPEPGPSKSEMLKSILEKTSSSTASGQVSPGNEGEQLAEDRKDETEGNIPARLVPLASSALPSIKDFLAMEQAVSGGSKKKRKGGPGLKGSEKKNPDAKLERDFKRLKGHREMKEATQV